MVRLLSLLKPRRKELLGLQLARELDKCAEEIMSIFQITDYQRDYENAWEWIEGDDHAGTKVNISRTHNWKTGNYERPILISISAPVLSEEKLSDYALQLANTLKTEVWIGKVDWETQNERDYQFEIKNRIKPVE